MNNTTSVLFALIRSVICGNQLTEKDNKLLSDDLLKEIFIITKKHNIAHLITLGLNVNGMPQGKEKYLEDELIRAVCRYERMNYTYLKLCEILEEFHIPFIPLKGSVLCKYYPEPWMRTNCDIDILVHKEYSEKVAAHLVDNYGYTYIRKGPHDILLCSPNKIHIELHYNLDDDSIKANNTSIILADVWNRVFLKKESSYFYVMTDEMFYFYHIAHMAKHFEKGGCGIRAFIDLWLLNNMEGIDKSKRIELLKKGNLLKFAEISSHLSRVWFGEENHNKTTLKMEQYILRGGVFGSMENRVEIQKQQGQLGYLLSRIFLPYNQLKYEYPCLINHKWLMPAMEVKRWCRLVFADKAKQAVREFKYSMKTSNNREEIKTFLRDVGL